MNDFKSCFCIVISSRATPIKVKALLGKSLDMRRIHRGIDTIPVHNPDKNFCIWAGNSMDLFHSFYCIRKMFDDIDKMDFVKCIICKRVNQFKEIRYDIHSFHRNDINTQCTVYFIRAASKIEYSFFGIHEYHLIKNTPMYCSRMVGMITRTSFVVILLPLF